MNRAPGRRVVDRKARGATGVLTHPAARIRLDLFARRHAPHHPRGPLGSLVFQRPDGRRVQQRRSQSRVRTSKSAKGSDAAAITGPGQHHAAVVPPAGVWMVCRPQPLVWIIVKPSLAQAAGSWFSMGVPGQIPSTGTSTLRKTLQSVLRVLPNGALDDRRQVRRLDWAEDVGVQRGAVAQRDGHVLLEAHAVDFSDLRSWPTIGTRLGRHAGAEHDPAVVCPAHGVPFVDYRIAAWSPGDAGALGGLTWRSTQADATLPLLPETARRAGTRRP